MNSGPQPRTPRTLFSIADILGPRRITRGPSTSQLPESSPGPTSPLCALEELTSKTFLGLEGHAPESSEGTAPARSCTLTRPSPHLSPPGPGLEPSFTLAATLIRPLPSTHVLGLASPDPPLPSIVSRLRGSSWRLPARRGWVGLSRSECPVGPFSVGGPNATKRDL